MKTEVRYFCPVCEDVQWFVKTRNIVKCGACHNNFDVNKSYKENNMTSVETNFISAIAEAVVVRLNGSARPLDGLDTSDMQEKVKSYFLALDETSQAQAAPHVQFVINLLKNGETKPTTKPTTKNGNNGTKVPAGIYKRTAKGVEYCVSVEQTGRCKVFGGSFGTEGSSYFETLKFATSATQEDCGASTKGGSAAPGWFWSNGHKNQPISQSDFHNWIVEQNTPAIEEVEVIETVNW